MLLVIWMNFYVQEFILEVCVLGVLFIYVYLEVSFFSGYGVLVVIFVFYFFWVVLQVFQVVIVVILQDGEL